MKWVYVESEIHRLWTVGFFEPNGTWHTDGDHASKEDAAKRTAWLNGNAAIEMEWEQKD